MKPKACRAYGFRGAKVLTFSGLEAHFVVKNVKSATANVMFSSYFAYIRVEVYF